MIFLAIDLYDISPFGESKRVSLRPGFNTVIGPNGSGKTRTYQALTSLLADKPLDKSPFSGDKTAKAAVTFEDQEGEVYRISREYDDVVWNFSRLDPNSRKFQTIESERKKIMEWLDKVSGGLGGKERGLLFMIDRFRLPSHFSIPSGNEVLALIDLDEKSLASCTNMDTGGEEEAGKVRSEKEKALKAAEQEMEVLGDLENEMLMKRDEADAIREGVTQFREHEKKIKGMEEMVLEKFSLFISEGTITPERLREYEAREIRKEALLDELKEEKHAVEAELFLVKEGKRKKDPLFFLGFFLVGASFLMPFSISLVGPFRYLFLAGVLGGSGLSSVAYYLQSKRSGIKKTLAKQLLELNKEEQQLGQKFKKENEAVFDFIKKTGSRDLSELKTKQQDYFNLFQLKQKEESACRKIKALFNGKTIEVLSKEADLLKEEVVSLQEKLEAHEEISQEVYRLQGELQGAKVGTELHIAKLSDLSDPCTDSGSGVERNGQELPGAFFHSLLSIAGGETTLSKERLEKNADILYRSFHHENSESIQLKENGEIIVGKTPLSDLSSGTADQVFLSLSLSALSQFSEVSFPIVLDDPLSALDASSKEAALKILHVISKKRQVILFSSNAMEPAGDHVVSLV